MKILYITAPSYFDLDISLIRELSKFVEINVLLVVSSQSKKTSAFSITKLPSVCDIIQAQDYAEMQKYKGFLDDKKWFIANNPDNSLKSCFKLAHKIKKFIKDNHYDLIHTTSCCKTLFFLMPFLFFFKKTMLTVHDPIPHGKISWFDNFFRRKLYFRANKNLLFLSKSLLIPFCKKYGFKKEKIYFSSLSVYDILNQYDKKNNVYGEYILFFGRIEPYKGVELLIDAFARTGLSSKGVKLVVAVNGKFKYNSDVSGNVIVINRFIENSELANLIFYSKYVVLPYLTATQSGCVMSAFAFNKPVLATNVGDLPLTVKDGELGIICNPNDVNGLAKAIDKMYEGNLEQMALNIKDKYQNNGESSWISIAKSLCDVYQHIINSKSY